VPELSGRELLREWQKLMESVVATAASAAGRPDLPRQLVEPMQRQLELVQELVERERRLQQELVAQLVAPADAVFDLLEESGATLRRQAEALEAAGSALEETAALMRRQAELFERTIGALRQPTELVKAAAAVERRPRPKGRGSRR
jgi:ABC-type transporter Mla subunit MlaD